MGLILSDLAEVDADKIEKMIRGSPDHLGKRITKSSLRQAFRIPWVRSSMVWEVMKQRGAIVDQYTVMIKPTQNSEKS